jgi:hypothetical protein
MRVTKFLLSLAVSVLLIACAGTSTRPVSVVVGQDDFQVLGNSAKTVDELMRLLAEKKVTSIDLHNAAGNNYERIGRVVYGMARHGVKIEAIDGQATK